MSIHTLFGFTTHHPKYERDEPWPRILLRILVSAIRYPLYRKLNPNDPYYAPGAINFLKNEIDQREAELKMFEFGLGKSTFWWLQFVNEYIGVEHDRSWYEQMQSQVDEFPGNHIQLRYAPAASDDHNRRKTPADINYDGENPEFSEYLAQIEQFPDNYFDIISIDGRERVGAAHRAISKVKPSGIIVLDDSNRPSYRPAMELFVHDWTIHRFDFGIQQTAVIVGRAKE